MRLCSVSVFNDLKVALNSFRRTVALSSFTALDTSILLATSSISSTCFCKGFSSESCVMLYTVLCSIEATDTIDVLAWEDNISSSSISATVAIPTDQLTAFSFISLKVYDFSDVVESAALKKEPHLITNYVYDLASMFHNYYGKHRILTDNIEESSERLGLIKVVQITIKNALRLIGVKAIDKM